MAWLIVIGVLLALWFINRGGRRKSSPRSAVSRPYDPPVSPTASQVSERTAIASRAPGRWVPPGETVKIAGLTIESGMIYVGGALERPMGYGDENCLIDPELRVAGDDPDVLGQTMSYWPSYGAIHPRARLAYLTWLAEGRKTPGVGIGFVFLFFYGLERRVFVDKAEADYPALAAEVRRLLDLYGDNHSFKGYARRFLALLDVFADRGATPPALRPDLRDGYELPLDVRFHLGLTLKEGRAFSADDALLWMLALPDTYPRTPAVRCFDELCALWRVRFAEQWPAGLPIRCPQTELKLSYRSASGTFQGSFSADVPDIASVQGPIPRLRDLLNACSSELEAYSRLIGKRPEVRGALEAATLLPRALIETPHGASVARARERVHALLGGQAIALSVASKVSAALEMPVGAAAYGHILDALGVGFEPDRRFGALTAADGETVVLFRCEDAALPSDLDTFKAARTLVEIAVLAATADGTLDPAEFEVVNDEIRSLPDLTEPERTRLLAYALALAKAPPKPQGILNRAGRLDGKKRDLLVRAATGAILADGRVTGEEVKYLERLYKALGLPPAEVYAALHRGAGGRDEPVTVAEAQPDPGSPVPRPQPAEPAGLAIDPARLGQVRAQTQAVSSLLSQVFSEEPAPTPVAAPIDEAPRPTPYAGLDAAHAQLLHRALSAEGVSWADFEDEARRLRLMPDGALETLNDWAFDRFDEPLLEPGEHLVAPEHLRAQLRELETAA